MTGVYEDGMRRVIAHSTVTANGCWEWPGKREYTTMMFRGRIELAHRVAYLLWRGPIAQVLDHLCRNTHCVNPWHLEDVSRRTNTLRGMTIAAAEVARIACPQGHPYSAENTYMSRSGKRHCRECGNQRQMRRYWRTHERVRQPRIQSPWREKQELWS